jgi:hypothetical protein
VAGAVGAVLVALIDEAETGKGEQFVDLGDEFGAACDKAGKATGGDGASVWA